MAITQRCKTTLAKERVTAEGRSSSDYLLISLPKFIFTALLRVFTYILMGKAWAGYTVEINKYIYPIILFLNSPAWLLGSSVF